MRTLTLLLLALLFPLAAAHCQDLPRVHGPGDQNWDTRFGPAAAGGLGLNDDVWAIAELPNGDLVVTGDFLNAGGDPNADYIARWDGTAWHALGTGLFLNGYALAVAPNGDVFVGGYFYSAGGVANTNKIARWDGTAWQSLGTGAPSVASSDRISALAFLPNGDLLAGGYFTDMGGTPGADYLARWDGTTWHRFAAPLFFSRIEDIAVAPNGDVVVCGQFNFDPSSTHPHFFARWNGSVWQSIGATLDASVVTMAFAPNGDLFVGGGFTNLDGVPGTNKVARWDGTAWHPLGTGVNAVVTSLATCPNGDILFGGGFLDAGGNPFADFIARWDGTAWQNLGTGLALTSRFVRTLYGTTAGNYVVGGSFASVGDGSVLMENFGIYHANAVGLPEGATAPTTLRTSPNPAHGTLQAQLPARFTSTLTLTDATGRTVRTQALATGQTTATLNLEGVAPGVYVLRAGAAVQRVLVD